MTATRGILVGLALLCAAAFACLGVWQVERRAWKLDLIERVEARVNAAPAPLPPPAAWPNTTAERDEYRRVTARGRFLHEREVLVQASTARGPGFWVMTPLETADGIVLVNRGFVDAAHRAPATRAAARVEGPAAVTGLVRMSEPGGGFLRKNKPMMDRWYSRDVAAILAGCASRPHAPFFVDADATPNPGGWPVGGLTVVAFRNNHLVYAITWFGLALLSAGGAAAMLLAGRPRVARA